MIDSEIAASWEKLKKKRNEEEEKAAALLLSGDEEFEEREEAEEENEEKKEKTLEQQLEIPSRRFEEFESGEMRAPVLPTSAREEPLEETVGISTGEKEEKQRKGFYDTIKNEEKKYETEEAIEEIKTIRAPVLEKAGFAGMIKLTRPAKMMEFTSPSEHIEEKREYFKPERIKEEELPFSLREKEIKKYKKVFI